MLLTLIHPHRYRFLSNLCKLTINCLKSLSNYLSSNKIHTLFGFRWRISGGTLYKSSSTAFPALRLHTGTALCCCFPPTPSSFFVHASKLRRGKQTNKKKDRGSGWLPPFRPLKHWNGRGTTPTTSRSSTADSNTQTPGLVDDLSQRRPPSPCALQCKKRTQSVWRQAVLGDELVVNRSWWTCSYHRIGFVLSLTLIPVGLVCGFNVARFPRFSWLCADEVALSPESEARATPLFSWWDVIISTERCSCAYIAIMCGIEIQLAKSGRVVLSFSPTCTCEW